MSNFFIIDHSLRKSGGHHFDYVSCVAQAANELGFLTTIGANREFTKANSNDHACLGRLGNVRRTFRSHTYQPDSYLAGLQHLTRSNSGDALLDVTDLGWVRRFFVNRLRNSHRRRRERFVRNFASDCDRFFRPLLQTGNDHAFFTTVSELELMGLAAYLSSQPKTLNTTWHLQFHFNLFEGRNPDYEHQQYLAKAIKACFLASLSRLSYHSINFYATSEVLVDQYNRLGVGEFERLPYPVSPEFGAKLALTKNAAKTVVKRQSAAKLKLAGYEDQGGSDSEFGSDQMGLALPLANAHEVSRPQIASSTSGGESDLVGDEPTMGEGFREPLRITCPGEVRREKNQIQYLQPLVDRIWPTHLATGNAQIVLQRPSKKWHSRKQKLEVDLPECASELLTNPIEYFTHPLDKPSYIELIQSSDCGLLFYDSRVYYSRRAGVLGEMLSAGKPVIVPAGSWLAQQIQEPIFQYVDKIVDSPRNIGTIESSEFNWSIDNVPMAGGILSFDGERHPFSFNVDRGQSELLRGGNVVVLGFDWHWPTESGVFCRIELEQKDAFGKTVNSASRVVGHRDSNGKVVALFQLEPSAESFEFSLTNAFHDSTASIRRVDLQVLSWLDEGEASRGLPIGQVGIIASDVDDLPNCVDEFVQHSNHYAESAGRFAKSWYAQHAPQKTVEHLVGKSKANRYVA